MPPIEMQGNACAASCANNEPPLAITMVPNAALRGIIVKVAFASQVLALLAEVSGKLVPYVVEHGHLIVANYCALSILKVCHLSFLCEAKIKPRMLIHHLLLPTVIKFVVPSQTLLLQQHVICRFANRLQYFV